MDGFCTTLSDLVYDSCTFFHFWGDAFFRSGSSGSCLDAGLKMYESPFVFWVVAIFCLGLFYLLCLSLFYLRFYALFGHRPIFHKL